ncbi:MAG: hypothetical protein AMQ22_00199 [Candidatus Methanofastidiosum methylothiophilum]|uniref:Phage capsid family protein n=1 Tax=Candidatus Methanofastidiosum methylothiophilum TaxID=1705564 RepID=A0A150IS99_9EURY|nr:MAG: hypothetical protein APG11_00842 [Candidatus Methanofastidiosum methylthiophilus]KYC53528.1 MAG: hypothetical protein AMQ22_00199 [Candidatus Methanofastidiosum methylthiophilus]
MAYTNLADVIVPEVLADMVSAQIATRAKIIRSGIASFDYANVDISEGGNFFNVPYWDELTGDSEVIDGVNQITVNALSTLKDIGVVLHRGKAWGVTDLARFAGLGDPQAEIAAQVANYWGKEYDRLFIKIVGALIDLTNGALKDSHVHNVKADTGTPVLFDTSVCVDAAQKIGENMDELTGLIVHSKTYADLLKAKLIDFVEMPSTDETYRTGRIPTFMGKEVIVSDALPVNSTPDNDTYTTYLFGRGAGYVGYQRQLMTEKDRDILAFRNVLSTSVHFGLHLKLVKWNVSTVNPTDTNLATATNWLKVATNNKLIRFVAVLHN